VGRDLICPKACGPEAAWASDLGIVAAPDLMSLLNHLRGSQMLAPPGPDLLPAAHQAPDMSDLKGQEIARRVLEITVAGQHNLLLVDAGQLPAGGLIQLRPFRDPHHSASMAALVGGGARARPSEISLAHGGVLFLDELAEFTRPVLDALR
jgi:magnesium chelatase family protein